MKIRYYISPRFLGRGLPFWVVPLILFISLGIVLIWSLISLQMNPSNRVFEGVKRYFVEDKTSSSNQYSLGMTNFRNRSYYTSAKIFQEILRSSQALSPSLRQKTVLYYGFSLLFYGESQKDSTLIQNAKDSFESLTRSLSFTDPLYARALWGYARAARYLNTDYPPETGSYLTSFARESQSLAIKKSLYLELGYYYFSLNDLPKASTYFKNSLLMVDFPRFYEDALSKEGSEVLLLQLLLSHQISEPIIYSYGASIAQKLMNWAIRYMNMGQYSPSYGILLALQKNFRTEEALENIIFFMGYLEQKQSHWDRAMNHYQRVVSNGYTDKDPAAYFNMAVIYWNVGKRSLATHYLEILVTQYPYTYYGVQAQKWLSRLNPQLLGSSNGSINNSDTTPMPSVLASSDSTPNFSKSYDREMSYSKSSPLPAVESQATEAQPKTVETPQKPVVNVNIDQSRTFTNNSDSNNTTTSQSRSETNARNYTSDRRDSGNTSTLLSQKQNKDSSVHDNAQSQDENNYNNSNNRTTTQNRTTTTNTTTQEGASLDKDFESAVSGGSNSSIPAGYPREENERVLFEPERKKDDAVLFESKGSKEPNVTTPKRVNKDDLGSDFDSVKN